MIILDCEQGSREWYEARAGIPTASNFDKIITSHGKRSTQFQTYLNKVAAASLIGPQETYSNDAMADGVENEPKAIAYYEMQKDCDVERVGLCYKDEERLFSCSPDGLLSPTGGLEVKCPLPHTHVSYLRASKCPSKYYSQVQGQIYICEREWMDFMSFRPPLRTFIFRVFRNDDFIESLEHQLIEFCDQLEIVKQRIK